jgi:F-type H+-transporting ATPase subunit delta
MIMTEENRDFAVFLKSPIIHVEKKMEVFNALFEGKVEGETLNFYQLVVQKGREKVLPLIMQHVIEEYKKMKGITTVTITSASEMSEKEFDRISDKLRKSGMASENVEYIQKIDPAIIGGFVIEIGDKLYDASVAGKLKKLRKELI